tara:strand:+ start:384 stop:881 length:498 start_codon:yes stop_codon:yes gene_type:complete
VKESANPEHYAARRLGYRKEGSYIPDEIEKLIKTIKVMYIFEQQLHDRIEVLKRDKENKEVVLSTYIGKKSDPQGDWMSMMNKLNREIVDLNDKIKLLERIKYDYVDFQDKMDQYINNFCGEGNKRNTEKFITDKMDWNIKEAISDEEAEHLYNGAEDAMIDKMK